MSTSDQPESTPLTRKQLREIRLTGATTVITPEEAAAAASPPAPVLPPAAEPVEPTPVVSETVEEEHDAADGNAPLTRRQAREAERVRTASVPVITPEPEADDAAEQLVSGVPSFDDAGPEARMNEDADLDEDIEENVDVAPVSAVYAPQSTGDVEVIAEPVVEDAVAAEPVVSQDAAGEEAAEEDDAEPDPIELLEVASDDTEADEPAGEDDPADDADDEDLPEGERPVVSPTFGEGVLSEAADVPTFAPSFDELLSSDSNGSQHLSPSTLIFTPSPGEGSLSGPVASTGEILVTGSYELPQGIGSQGHAHGVADGKDIDSVLIDGELPPASSPTPIAASAAISTIKPAGEVIRPPAPEKGNRLMLVLAITAGGLALVLAAALIVAFTMNVFN